VDDLIAPELAGLNADYQEEIDNTLHELDGTTDFKNIGGNTAFCAISLANAEAAANSHGFSYSSLLAETPQPPCRILLATA
jgi:enolase